jgi:hypothetical protein
MSMKNTLALLTIAFLALTARAADNVTSNYLGAVVYVPATYTNAGDSGLVVSTAYLAIPAAGLGITTGNVEDIRAVMYQINQTYYTAWTASTNKAASSISRNARYANSSTNVVETITHSLRTERVASTFELE